MDKDRNHLWRQKKRRLAEKPLEVSEMKNHQERSRKCLRFVPVLVRPQVLSNLLFCQDQFPLKRLFQTWLVGEIAESDTKSRFADRCVAVLVSHRRNWRAEQSGRQTRRRKQDIVLFFPLMPVPVFYYLLMFIWERPDGFWAEDIKNFKNRCHILVWGLFMTAIRSV